MNIFLIFPAILKIILLVYFFYKQYHKLPLQLILDPQGILPEDPKNLPGLLMHLDGDSLSEQNGSILTLWSDSSGSGRSSPPRQVA